MIIAGLWYAVKSYKADEDHGKEGHKHQEYTKNVSNFEVLGAALSPDLLILPIFLIAIPVGINFAIQIAIVFAIASIVTLLVLVLIGHHLVEHSRFAKRLEKLDSRYNDVLTGLVIAAVGIYMILFS